MCPFKTKKCLSLPGTLARYSCLFLIFVQQVCLAQTNNILFHHLTVDNGLPSGLVHNIYQDAHNFMWFGTDAGLCRFDGIKCKTFQSDANDTNSLRGNHVYAMNEDGLQQLCVLTERGLNVYNNATGNFTFYPFVKAPSPLSSHVIWNITRIAGGNMLIEAGDAPPCIFNINTKQFAEITADEAINDKYISAVKPGTLFKTGPGARSLDIWPQKNNITSKKNIVFKDASHPQDVVYIASVAPIAGNVIWAATSKGLAQYNISNGATYFFTPTGYGNITFGSIMCAGNMLWLGSANNGIWLFNTSTLQFAGNYIHSDVNSKSPQDSAAIDLLFCDRQGNIWADFFAHGVDYFNTAEQKFTTYLGDKEAGQNNRDNFIRALSQDSSGNVWAGTYSGQVYRFGAGKKIVATYTTDEQGRHFRSIEKILVDGKKRVWLLDDGLSYYDAAANKFIRIFAAAEQPFAHDIFLGGNKNLYFLNHNYNISILRDSANGFTTAQTNITSVLNNLSVILGDNDNIYTNDVNGNILVYRPSGNVLYTLQKVLPVHGYIKAWYRVKNIVWIATSSGLVRLNTQTFQYSLFTFLNGLPENTVYSVLPGGSNDLWLSTNKGLSRFDTVKQKFTNYTTGDGLQGNEFNTNAYLRCSDGEMWFGGVHGLNIFYPSAIKANMATPPLQITAVNVNDEPYTGIDVLAAGPLLSLPYSQRTVSFSFTGIDYLRPSSVVLQYRLTGIDRDWITTANPGFARYANLPAGKYTLQVRAAGGDITLAGSVKTMQLIIATPYYQAWWFIALVCIAVFALLYGWYFYRISQVKKMHMVRNRIARDLHDDIGSSISSIRIMTDIVQGSLENNPAHSGELIKRIGNESAQVMDSIRDIVWTINPDNDQLGNLFIRMREYAAEMLEAQNIDYTFNASDYLQGIRLSMQMRRDLYLIFKEAINNLAKYSKCTRAEISIGRTLNKLVLCVKDNGAGFNMQQVKRGNGLTNMQVRATQLKAVINIQSEVLKGTVIRLEVPVT